jgi:preprotein translocase subunit SecD
MRLLFASMAALAALAFAAPSFAQTEDPSAAPAPVPTTKPKPGTTAYCQTLKSSTSRSACMKKLHAQATPKAAPTTTKKKTKKTTTATSQPEVGQLSPPPAASSPAPAPAPTGGTVAVPPLPQKTI